jgi:hypothetical protein
MMQYELLRDQGVLTLKPDGALRAEDFVALASAVDPYIEQHGELNGLMLEAQSFPGWDDFAALVSHVRFVRDHHRRLRRIAWSRTANCLLWRQSSRATSSVRKCVPSTRLIVLRRSHGCSPVLQHNGPSALLNTASVRRHGRTQALPNTT